VVHLFSGAAGRDHLDVADAELARLGRLLGRGEAAPSIWSGMLCCSMLPASPLARLGARALSTILSSLDSAGMA
jgi:hypothetical protein